MCLITTWTWKTDFSTLKQTEIPFQKIEKATALETRGGFTNTFNQKHTCTCSHKYSVVPTKKRVNYDQKFCMQKRENAGLVNRM